MLREIIRSFLNNKTIECDLNLYDFICSAITISCLDKANDEYFFTFKFVNIIVEIIEKNTRWTENNEIILLKNIACISSKESRKEFVNVCLPALIRLLILNN
jgi:hypothetical protein